MGIGLRMLDEEGVQIDKWKRVDCGSVDVEGGGGGNGGLTEGIKVLRLRTALHTLKLSPQNSFGESHS